MRGLSFFSLEREQKGNYVYQSSHVIFMFCHTGDTTYEEVKKDIPTLSNSVSESLTNAPDHYSKISKDVRRVKTY